MYTILEVYPDCCNGMLSRMKAEAGLFLMRAFRPNIFPMGERPGPWCLLTSCPMPCLLNTKDMKMKDMSCVSRVLSRSPSADRYFIWQVVLVYRWLSFLKKSTVFFSACKPATLIKCLIFNRSLIENSSRFAQPHQPVSLQLIKSSLPSIVDKGLTIASLA